MSSPRCSGRLLVAPITGFDFDQVLRPTARVVLLGLRASPSPVPAIVLWLRWLERRDPSHDAPPVDERLLREMARREDWIPQNHMGSVVLVKPGVLRMALFRAGHLGLGLVLRVVATDGYLGSMRTVHFAHWAFVNNGSRLMFFSNFDHSWESYLDDFIEKAHGGLTLAWGSGVGFPPTRFLVLDGASHGRKFKAWARHSMAVSRFWFSAYRDFTVDQIERNARIADGLRKATLSDRRPPHGRGICDRPNPQPACRPVAGQRSSWKLKPPHDAQTQGIVVSGFSDLPAAKALFLMCDWPENGPDAATDRRQGCLAAGSAAGCTRSPTATARRRVPRARLHLDRPAEVGPRPRRAGDIFGAVSRGHVPGGPAAPPRRQVKDKWQAPRHRRWAALERQHACEG